MKTKYLVLATMVTLGMLFGGLTKQAQAGAQLSSMQSFHGSGIVELGAWYRMCPVMPNVILNPKHSTEVTLSNGKRIMLSCGNCKDAVEKDLAKYEIYMY